MHIPANDPALRSWVPVPLRSDFPIQNLPFGMGLWNGEEPAPMTRIGDRCVDLGVLAEAGLLDGLGMVASDFQRPVLNGILAHGKPALRALRQRLSDLLREGGDPALRNNNDLRQ